MTTSAREVHQALLVRAVRTLVEGARSRRANLPQQSSERAFYLGVDAAAQELLHPELGMSRAPSWLELQLPAFREGYLRTADMLAMARTADQPPLRLALPEFTGAVFA
jgi:hypothetical protein